MTNTLLQACSDLLMVVSPATLQIVAANDKCAHLGYGDQLVGKSIVDIEADIAEVLYWNGIATGAPAARTNADGVFACADGTPFPVTKTIQLRDGWLLLHARPRIDEADAETQARDLALMRATLESVSEGIIALDPDGKVLHFNHPFAKMWGLSPEKVIDITDRSLLRHVGHKVRRGAQLLEWLRNGLTSRDASMHYTISLRDGRVFECRAQPQTDEDEILGRVISLSDITEREQRECDLAAARDAALAAAKAKSDFLAVMSHEIRTPMNGILGMASILADTSLDDAQKDYVGVINQSGESLLGIINDVLDFAKIDAGKLSLHKEEFDLRDVVDGVADMMAVKAAERKLEFAVNFPPEIPSFVEGDAGRIRQVLLNLAGNAVKFTEQGGVSIVVPGWRRRGDFLQICFEVRDTGIGIPAHALERLFTPFEQADGSITRRYGGTGLGLSITRQLIHLMGGIIDVRSKEGAGSVFRMILNFPITREPAAPDDLSQAQVAVVMPDKEPRRSVLAWLAHWKIAPLLDPNVILNPRTHVDFALVDPFDDASHVFLAKAKMTQPNIRMVQMLPLGAPRDHAFATMYQHTVAMPLHPDTLAALLRSPLPAAVAAAKRPLPTASAGGATADGLRVLIVEDNLANQKVISHVVTSAGYRFDLAFNGLDAIEHVKNNSYDVILMDCQMPEMDGVTATVKIRELGVETPIIALTAGVFNQDKETCLAAGMNAFLTKPVKKLDVIQTIQALCPEASAPPPAAPVAPAAAIKDVSPIPYDEILAASDGDHVIARVILESTHEGLPTEVAAYRDALDAGDWKRARRAAHTLKGMLRSIYMTHAADAAEYLENAAMMEYLPTAALIRENLSAIADACLALRNLIMAKDGKVFPVAHCRLLDAGLCSADCKSAQ